MFSKKRFFLKKRIYRGQRAYAYLEDVSDDNGMVRGPLEEYLNHERGEQVQCVLFKW